MLLVVFVQQKHLIYSFVSKVSHFEKYLKFSFKVNILIFDQFHKSFNLWDLNSQSIIQIHLKAMCLEGLYRGIDSNIFAS
jgi:hypothetical protein